MKSLLKLLYPLEKIEIKIPEYKKRNKGGCVIYCLANILNRDPKEIASQINKPLDYWFNEREILELEKVFPIKVENYKREKVIESLRNGKPVVFCFYNHCVVCYGYEKKKDLKFYIFDISGKFKNEKERNLKNIDIILIRNETNLSEEF